MNTVVRMLCLSSVVMLSACGGSGEFVGQETDQELNVAASANGGSASAFHNSGTAGNLIDGNTGTSWTSDSEEAIVVRFSSTASIRSITLTRLAAAASLGTDPDILVELSTDGDNYSRSNMSVISGGIPCTALTSSTTTMSCTMSGYDARYVRITTADGKAFSFTELEVIAVR